MRLYVKGYSQRVILIVIVVLTVISSSLINYIMFHGKLSKVSGQICSYNSSDYSILYTLNYGCAFDNECIFSDTNIIFYTSTERSERLSVSGIMKEEGVSYNLKYLSFMKELKPGEICVSLNVAEKYKLEVGDVIYADISYKAELVPLKIASVIETEFDLVQPNIDNEIGIVFVGYDELYATNTISKYILFADRSKSDELSAHPQIINAIVNKSANINYVAKQSIPAILVETLMAVGSVIAIHILFYSKSEKLLFRCFLKGMSRRYLWMIPLVERIAFCCIPSMLIQFIITLRVSESYILVFYRIIPTLIYLMYTVIFLMKDLFKSKLKRS